MLNPETVAVIGGDHEELPKKTKMIGLCRRLGFDIRYTLGEVIVELNLKGDIFGAPEVEILARFRKTFLKARSPIAKRKEG